MDNRPIGVFDSGVGGLSILKEVKKILPHESFIYLADQANNPYGDKTTSEIQKIASSVVSFLLSKNAKLIIVACNTASVNAIDSLRLKFNIPIVAVVPVIKTLADKTNTKKTAVFSTPATANSKYLKDLIEKYAPDIEVFRVGTSRLEHLVEKGVVAGDEVEQAIKISMAPLLAKNVDSIALGCTHYPFLTSEIKRIVGPKVSIYDSGGAVARRVKTILTKEGILASEKGMDYYYTTGNPDNFKKVADKLLHKQDLNILKAEL